MSRYFERLQCSVRGMRFGSWRLKFWDVSVSYVGGKGSHVGCQLAAKCCRPVPMLPSMK